MTKERWITKEDFEKAKKALEDANVPKPYSMISTMPLQASRKPAGEFK